MLQAHPKQNCSPFFKVLGYQAKISAALKCGLSSEDTDHLLGSSTVRRYLENLFQGEKEVRHKISEEACLSPHQTDLNRAKQKLLKQFKRAIRLRKFLEKWGLKRPIITKWENWFNQNPSANEAKAARWKSVLRDGQRAQAQQNKLTASG